MKFTTATAFSLLAAASVAQASPIRVLVLGTEEKSSRQHTHVLMRELGRDAIWFEYSGGKVAPDWAARFDAILLDGQSAPGGVDARKTLTLDFASNEKAWAAGDFITAAKEKILTAAGDTRRKEWEKFLSQRETEQREANPNVANYEKRPEPLTFQKPMTVKGSMERTQVAPDLKLSLFASEPEIGKPIAFAWDERGRCWVCETSDYPHDVAADGVGKDSIKICEDTDGDGKADKFTVFADKLNIPTGITFARGGVIISQPPRFIFLKDTNGDDKADVRQDIMTGWGIGDTHAQASNLHTGYDNWLYGCVGYSGFNGTVGGKTLKFAQGTYRFKADGSEMQFLHQFSNNSWGHSYNSAGDQFGGTANNAPIFYGGIPATFFPSGMNGMSAKKINVEPRVHTTTPNFRQVDWFEGYTAAAGSAFIYSDTLPKRLQGKAMVCEPTMKTIGLMDIQPNGAGYTAQDGFNLYSSTDEWNSPVYAEVGPDGAIWIADFQNFIIQHNPTPKPEFGGYTAKTGVGGAHENPLRDHSRGRIYRITGERGAAKAPNLTDATPSDLVRYLAHDTQYVRLMAQRLLVERRRTETAPSLTKIITANDGNIAAIHALWALSGLSSLDDTTHRAALLARDPALRRNAIRALGNDTKDTTLYFGTGVLSDPDPVTRLAALVKLGDFPTTPEIQTIVRGLATDQTIKADEWLAEAAKGLGRKHKAVTYKEGPNLLANGDLEKLNPDGLPEAWKRRDYPAGAAGNPTAEWKIVNLTGDQRSGKNGLRATGRTFSDTSLHQDVPVKPNTEYRLSAWIKTRSLRGKASLNAHATRIETEKISTRDSAWVESETTFNSEKNTRLSINILFVGTGDATYDDIKLAELLPSDASEIVGAGDAKRGEQIFYKHPAAACVACHMLKGQGSTVGPALDGIAKRKDAAYIRESLLEPGKVLAEGFQQLGVSPMPPMALILKPQEIADLEAFLGTLK